MKITSTSFTTNSFKGSGMKDSKCIPVPVELCFSVKTPNLSLVSNRCVTLGYKRNISGSPFPTMSLLLQASLMHCVQ